MTTIYERTFTTRCPSTETGVLLLSADTPSAYAGDVDADQTVTLDPKLLAAERGCGGGEEGGRGSKGKEEEDSKDGSDQMADLLPE